MKINNKDLVKVLAPIVAEIAKQTDLVDNMIHGVRWHMRHTLGMKFDRDEKEILDSIIWWNNKFTKIYIKNHHNKTDIADMKECYRVVKKRINELKTYNYKHDKHNVNYDAFYKDLEEMGNLLNVIGVQVI